VDEGGQLVPQGEILDHQVSAGEEGRSHGGEQQQTEAEHEATQNPSSLGNVKESGSDLVLATDNREMWIRDPNGYVVVLAGPDGEAR
jgi:hypothetical protein